MAEELSLEKFKVDPSKASKKDLEEAMLLLAKKRLRQEKVKRGLIKSAASIPWSEMTPEQKAKIRMANLKRTFRNRLYVEKAIAAGITVSDKEVEEAIKKAGK